MAKAQLLGAASGPAAGSAQFLAKQRRAKRRYAVLIGLLIAMAAVLIVLTLSYNNPAEFGTDPYWTVARKRAETLVVIGVVAWSHALATVAFQTVTTNRIITPSILGFESIYVLIQTSAIFLYGAAGLLALRGVWQFTVQTAVMVALATALFSWLLSSRFKNIHVLLLVGVVLGGGLRAISTFMQRLLSPNDFDLLTARMFGNIANSETAYLPIAIPLALAAGIALWFHARKLDVLSLGREVSQNLGLTYKRELVYVLLLVSVLIATTTALVGPMTFLGFLVATLTYSLVDQQQHRSVFPAAVLVGFVVLTLALFVMRHIFYAAGAVTIIIELIGGTVFLIVIMRNGKL